MQTTLYQTIDPLFLYRAAGDDLEAFRDLSGVFLRIAPPMLERLQQAIQSGDLAALRHESHSLKGTASLVGALQLTEALDDIERFSRQANTASELPVLPELSALFALVMQEVHLSIADFQGDTEPDLLLPE